MQIDLDEQEWRQVVAVLAQAPWATANPLIMKIGGQMQAHAAAAAEDHVQRQDRGNGADRKPAAD